MTIRFLSTNGHLDDVPQHNVIGWHSVIVKLLVSWKGAQALSLCIIVFYHKSLTYLYWLLCHCDITNTPDQFSLEFMQKT